MKEIAFPTNIQRPEWVAPLSDVLRFVLSVQTLIETPYQDNGEAVMNRISDLLSLYPQSANAIASAKWHRDTVLKDVIEEMLRKAKDNDEDAIRAFKTPSVIRQLAEARTAELNSLLVLTERLNSTITHSLDALRSVLSNLKEERRVQGYAQ
jgi:formate dehydrogenase maturation protein FdhE